MHRALVTRTAYPVRAQDGSSVQAEANVVLLRNRKKRVLGTRFFG